MPTQIDANNLDLTERIIATNKCQKTHKGGRTLSWSALVVVGDGEGHVGVGLGKARAIPDAIRKAVEAARRSIIKVNLSGGTLPHPLTVDFGASKVILRPASPGTGVVAGGSVRYILEAAGVRDVLSKSLGSNNPINTAWATMKGLSEMRLPEQVASSRGKELSDLAFKPFSEGGGA